MVRYVVVHLDHRSSDLWIFGNPRDALSLFARLALREYAKTAFVAQNVAPLEWRKCTEKIRPIFEGLEHRILDARGVRFRYREFRGGEREGFVVKAIVEVGRRRGRNAGK